MTKETFLLMNNISLYFGGKNGNKTFGFQINVENILETKPRIKCPFPNIEKNKEKEENLPMRVNCRSISIEYCNM